jgi:hypothetical protein
VLIRRYYFVDILRVINVAKRMTILTRICIDSINSNICITKRAMKTTKRGAIYRAKALKNRVLFEISSDIRSPSLTPGLKG